MISKGDIYSATVSGKTRLILVLSEISSNSEYSVVLLRLANRKKDSGSSLYLGRANGLRARSTVQRMKPFRVQSTSLIKKVATLDAKKTAQIEYELLLKRDDLIQEFSRLEKQLSIMELNGQYTTDIHARMDEIQEELGNSRKKTSNEKYKHAPSKSGIRFVSGGRGG
ncbi:MAG: hypothetical protein ACK5LX_16505 [Oscillospiraceae bacterium]